MWLSSADSMVVISLMTRTSINMLILFNKKTKEKLKSSKSFGCVVFLGKTLNTHSACLYPGEFTAGGNPAMD